MTLRRSADLDGRERNGKEKATTDEDGTKWSKSVCCHGYLKVVSAYSSTEPSRVYVRLLGEGTLVFRASPAEFLGASAARLVAPAGYDPEDEDWEFKPGSVVRVELRQLEGAEVYVAVALAE